MRPTSRTPTGDTREIVFSVRLGYEISREIGTEVSPPLARLSIYFERIFKETRKDGRTRRWHDYRLNEHYLPRRFLYPRHPFPRISFAGLPPLTVYRGIIFTAIYPWRYRACGFIPLSCPPPSGRYRNCVFLRLRFFSIFQPYDTPHKERHIRLDPLI